MSLSLLLRSSIRSFGPLNLRASLIAPSLLGPKFGPFHSTTHSNLAFRFLSTSPKPKNTTPSPVITSQQQRFTPEEIKDAHEQREKGLGVLKKMPESWIPYMELMRIEKPAGTWLLLIPGVWSVGMAAFMTSAPLLSTLWTLSIFTVGSFVMRGAGCTINDLWDRDLDNKVVRTIERPITSGRVPVKNAIVFLGAQMLVGLVILLQLPLDCFALGASSLVLVAVYPLFKRFTYYPQIALSACFNWAALLGFPAMGVWDWPVMIPLYLSGFFWCMHYDTIYGHQDKKFDVKVGIKSTALAWGDHSKQVFKVLAASQMFCFTLAGFLAGMGPGFYAGAAFGGYRLFNMILKVDLDDPKSCGFYFIDNIKTGHVFGLGIMIDYLLRLMGWL
ncbi:DEKNAAC102925 [Brettanomyces naardenensis]|uniref:4-hydroxybenzoate polyprenyltransferase, mitochondrial n=1 Tax=Brettanomyces naardenensis TaxID=13370 RepID=A0A448YM00_BRENA|nr:DEKNAAC102925 [Brettanomyces naardenensis]